MKAFFLKKALAYKLLCIIFLKLIYILDIFLYTSDFHWNYRRGQNLWYVFLSRSCDNVHIMLT